MACSLSAMHAHFCLVNRVPFARYNFIDTVPPRKGKRHLLSLAFPLVKGWVVQKTQPPPEHALLHMMTFLLHLTSTPVYGFRMFIVFSGERINREYQIVWAKPGRHGAHLLDHSATGLESQPWPAGRYAAPLCGAVGACSVAIGIIASYHR